jgi:hypothetical protein
MHEAQNHARQDIKQVLQLKKDNYSLKFCDMIIGAITVAAFDREYTKYLINKFIY